MKAVGIKALKNQLSRYLRDVQAGETIWVTDRDDVIAEIHRPTAPVPGRTDRWTAWINAETRAGRIRQATRKAPPLRDLYLPRPKGAPLDPAALLDLTREDRI